MNNWIADGHGNRWHRCKLGADCGLKVIEAGKARCWCQDQEASRVEMQAAREEISKLEDQNERLREDKERLMAALRENEISAAIISAENKRFGNVYAIERDCKFIANRAAEARIDAARKEGEVYQ